MQTQLTGADRATYDAVFRHPVARNLAWRDVRSMLDAFPDIVKEEHDGTLKISRNGRTITLRRPDRQIMTDIRELMNLRSFLE
jgi:hypothetical protein